MLSSPRVLWVVLLLVLGGCQSDQERAHELFEGPGAGTGPSARDALTEATRLDPTLRAAWSRLADLELADARWAEADAAATHAIELSDDQAHDRETRARARVALERWADAETDIAREIELGAPEAAARTRLGKVQEHLDRPEEAMASYRRAIALDEGSGEAQLALARMLLGPLETASESDAWQGDDAARAEVRALLDAARAASRGRPYAEEAVALSSALDALDQRAALLAARRQAASTGILALLGESGAWGSPGSVFGRESGLAADSPDLGALMGDSIGDSFGYGGLGLAGTGRGGGSGEGTIGLGNIGTIGHGGGTGSGVSYGRGDSLREGRGVSVRLDVTATGALTREVATRVVRRSVGSLRACYETALHDDPSLAGAMRIEATVSATGTAENARASGLGDAALASCMGQALARVAFPPAAGTTTITVSAQCSTEP